ncbi:MAG: V-type ATP synthase subunit F [Clostridiaceae bacterium]
MRAYIISDNTDSLVGMKIAGIDGIVAHTREEALKSLEYIKAHKDIGIIIITEKAVAFISEEIEEIRRAKYSPLVVEIQDRHGTMRGSDYIAKYMKESIGLKI